MISVPRNSHMPRDAASRCCSTLAKWCRSSGPWTVSTAAGLSLNGYLLGSGDVAVVVGFPGHFRRFVKIEGWRGRGRFPLQPGSAPGIVLSDFSVAHRPQEI